MIASNRNRQRKHAERASVVLVSAEGGPVQQVAALIGVSRPMVWRWQQRFAEAEVDGLLRDKTRNPGKPPIPAETVACLVALTCSDPPHQATHWTGRAMARARGGGFFCGEMDGWVVGPAVVPGAPEYAYPDVCEGWHAWSSSGRGSLTRAGRSCGSLTDRRSGWQALALHPVVRLVLPAPAARLISSGPSSGKRTWPSHGNRRMTGGKDNTRGTP